MLSVVASHRDSRFRDTVDPAWVFSRFVVDDENPLRGHAGLDVAPSCRVSSSPQKVGATPTRRVTLRADASGSISFVLNETEQRVQRS